MNRTIEVKDKLYAIVSDASEINKSGSSEWYGKSHEQLQGSRMNYRAGKSFKTHNHVLNPRIINRTQECFVVISGKIQIDIYKKIPASINKFMTETIIESHSINHLGYLTAEAGEALFVYAGFHKLTILEDAVFYEIKAGSFVSVDEDKEFLPEVD